MHIHLSWEEYGAVKTVGGTPVVTKFFAFGGFPLRPLGSYYFAGHGETKAEGIPLLFYTEEKSIIGLPLAHIDYLSVVMSYFRASCIGLILLGCIAMFFGLVMFFIGDRPDEGGVIMFKVLLCGLPIGLILGASSYLIPFQTSRREQKIRKLCGEYLGICADPAQVRADVACRLIDEIQVTSDVSDAEQRWKLLQDLVRTRVSLSHLAVSDGNRQVAELQTDELVRHLENEKY